ncbi:MAG: universal stress protein [Hydrogenophaga sp.]|uniref:universal stress protein n=1 Tax=Hydrogenophaga sp. TaxID=1904254 RepID=UPI002ABC312B|nr:universal stress protein [Hydrogenophaga sp.]MDZ4101531.1 universal stress protein [Hydrogenophaga sp.]MDZ4282086.1 universal stress protein [Hydrogenophaga sp.]
MHFDSILAVSDFSAHSAHALERAALLARQHQITLRLIHLDEGPNIHPSDPIARLGQRARQLARRYEIPVHAIERSATLDAVLAEAGDSSLLVMGPMLQRSWRKFHCGTTLDQAVHGSLCPLLVVKREPAHAYGHVLVAVDLSARTKPLIDFARWFSTPNVLKLFHAVDTIEDSKLRSVQASAEAIQANRFNSRQHARDRLSQVIGALNLPPTDSIDPSLSFEVGNGDPAYTTALHQLSTQAELVVVGKRPSSQLAQFFTGSVAQRLAKWAAGDVLIAPFRQLGVVTTADRL